MADDDVASRDPLVERIERERYLEQLQARYDKGGYYAMVRMILLLGVPAIVYSTDFFEAQIA